MKKNGSGGFFVPKSDLFWLVNKTGNAMDHDTFAKRVREVVYDTYDRIKNGGKPQSHEWTVLASILVEKEDKMEVIALATGTKCVGETQMSEKGLVVNDCHAEVLCRRAFLSFLMKEVEQFRSTGKSDYLEKADDSDKLQVKSGIQLHLYVSQTPCGYASEYTKKNGKREALECFHVKQRKSKRLHMEITTEEATDLPDHPDKAEDMHLSGAKFVDDSVRLSTKPGRGDHSRSYSCSDKICLWNLLGLQGAMLFLLLRPVYLTSIIISGEMEEAVAAEALYGRVVVPSLAVPFKQNRPVIVHDRLFSPLCEHEVMKTLEGKRLAASGSALVWVASGVQETLIARSGVRLGTNVKKGVTEKNMSVVCPLSLFRQFKALCASRSVGGITGREDYDEVKQAAEEYCSAKKRVMDPSLPCSLKAWRRKDRRFYHFQCSVCNKQSTRRS